MITYIFVDFQMEVGYADFSGGFRGDSATSRYDRPETGFKEGVSDRDGVASLPGRPEYHSWRLYCSARVVGVRRRVGGFDAIAGGCG